MPIEARPDVHDFGVLDFVRWLGDRFLGRQDRQRAHHVEVIDQTIRRYDATVAGFVDLLEGRRPRVNPMAVDAPFADAGAIGDDAAVVRLAATFATLEGMGRTGQLEALPSEERLLLRARLIDEMEAVRRAAAARRRRLV